VTVKNRAGKTDQKGENHKWQVFGAWAMKDRRLA
jgi:hypothetical protein